MGNKENRNTQRMTTDLGGIYIDLENIPRQRDGSDVPTRMAVAYIGALTKMIARRAEGKPIAATQSREPAPRFQSPSKPDVEAYFKEAGMNGTAAIEASKFVDYYDARDWMMGKVKMKKWKSAASGWKTRCDERNPVAGKSKREVWSQWLKSQNAPYVDYGQGNEAQKARFDREFAAGQIKV